MEDNEIKAKIDELVEQKKLSKFARFSGIRYDYLHNIRKPNKDRLPKSGKPTRMNECIRAELVKQIKRWDKKFGTTQGAQA